MMINKKTYFWLQRKPKKKKSTTVNILNGKAMTLIQTWDEMWLKDFLFNSLMREPGDMSQ